MPPSLRADAQQLSSWLRSVTDGNEQLCLLLPSIQQSGGGSGSSYSCLPGVIGLPGKRNGRTGTSLPEKSGDVGGHTEVGLGLLRDLQHESGNQFVTLLLSGEISGQSKVHPKIVFTFLCESCSFNHSLKAESRIAEDPGTAQPGIAVALLVAHFLC